MIANRLFHRLMINQCSNLRVINFKIYRKLIIRKKIMNMRKALSIKILLKSFLVQECMVKKNYLMMINPTLKIHLMKNPNLYLRVVSKISCYKKEVHSHINQFRKLKKVKKFLLTSKLKKKFNNLKNIA